MIQNKGLLHRRPCSAFVLSGPFAPRKLPQLKAKQNVSTRKACSVVRMMARAPWERGLPGDNEPDKPVQLSKSLDKADYLWNVEWQTEMDSMKRKEEEAAKPKIESGFLNLGRSGAMESLELDLSDERLQRTKSDVEEAAEKVVSPFKSGGPEKYPLEAAGWKYVPTRAEKKNWDKGQAMKSQKQDASQYSSLSAGDQTAVASEEDAEQKARKLEESRAEYSALQARLFLGTVAVGAVLAGIGFVWKGEDIAISCAVGSAFALLYLRLLAKGVDNVAGQGGGPSAPSLLVPVILVLAYRRWNEDYAEQVGVELSLLPMLLGFFSYKLSTILEVGYTLASYEVEEPTPKDPAAPSTGFTLSMPPADPRPDSKR